MNVGVAIMAHPQRKRYIPSLLGALDFPAILVWDRIGSRWETGARAMAARDLTTDWWLVVQDDAIPCPNLVQSLEKILQHVPDTAPVGLYIGRVSPFIQHLREVPAHTRWVTMPTLNWGVAVAVPTHTIDNMLDWCADRREQNYDVRLGAYYRTVLGQDCWYTFPSLVEHRQGRSLVAGRSPRRKAFSFIGQTKDPSRLDWSGRPVHVPVENPRIR